ncbi:4-alpha-glucanotransferase [Akkermansia sp. N21116]|jgi:4-alpha-glucanotransferase|uniref:4-alpha-glucanotransferase n=1 Tax=Akkermansia sp. N21116 TaxID=3040764 RepID=UPI00244EC1C5|nr:4-alpha-glucanotransferase [Akkermansia sp. N21116]WPX41552.1 4-alpha-glucanotransferase [Akkermansia sp. N21116]
MSSSNTHRLAGIVLPLFSVRRNNDHGIGDLIALREWIDWAADYDVGFLQLLPVNALGNDETPSPYSAISSIALEPLYIAMEPWSLPGMKERISFDVNDAPASQYPSGDCLVDYPKVRRFKYHVFRKCWSEFQTDKVLEGLRNEFEEWKAQQDQWLDDFACFKVLSSLFGTDVWWHWPEQDPNNARRIASEYEDEKEFEKWLQWVAFRQFGRLRKYADYRGVALMGDIPIGVSMASSDVFFERHLFDTDWCGGAPAEGAFSQDPFTAKWGQNWGIPLYRWDVMAHDNYAWWRRRLTYTAAIFTIYRIDHILGFYRIYAFPWKPTENETFLPLSYEEAAARTGGRLPGFKPRGDDNAWDRKQNLIAGDLYLRVLLAAASGVRVVGEDLGCVPDYVRPNMRQLGIAGFKIPHWEIDSDGRIIQGDRYNPCSFATYGTHDFSTIMETWNDAYRAVELAKKAGLFKRGVLADTSSAAQEGIRRDAANSLRLLNWFADYCGVDAKSMICPWNEAVKNAMFLALMKSRSDYAALMWTELFDLDWRLNVPGTVGGTNWRRRLPVTARAARRLPQSAWIKDVIVESGRVPDASLDMWEQHKIAPSQFFEVPILATDLEEVQRYLLQTNYR